jgi:periplasmic copper chaperone A
MIVRSQLNKKMWSELRLRLNRRHFAASLFFIRPAVAYAHSFKVGDIAIGHAWALPSQQNDGQVFFPLANQGKEHDELVAARSDISSVIELRQNNRYDDPPLTSIALEPKMPVPMRPTARHLRLMGLTRPLKKGDRFQMVLDFLNAGEVEIEVIVEDKPGD